LKYPKFNGETNGGRRSPKTQQRKQQTGLSRGIATTYPDRDEALSGIRPAGTRYALPGTRKIRIES
jgi:hypothetical protein